MSKCQLAWGSEQRPICAGSVPSLIAGGGSGMLLMLLGWLSLKAWKSGKKGASAPYTATSAGALLMHPTHTAPALTFRLQCSPQR